MCPATSFASCAFRPDLGRTLTPADAAAEEPVVVVSHGFWVRALGSPTVLPVEPLRIGTNAYRVVGVLPAAREYPAGVGPLRPVRVR